MSASVTRTAAKKRSVRKAVDDEPSAKSLKAIPEMSPDAVFLGRGPEGMRMAQGLSRAVRRGRPRKGEEAEGTSTRSIRLSGSHWAALEWACEQLELSPHAAMREAIVQWIARAGDKLKPVEKPTAKAATKSKPAKRAYG
jgi:hypothetical protein